MSGTLFIDACVMRDVSRTERLAQELISRLDCDPVETIILEDAGIDGLDSKTLEFRNECISKGDFSDPMFDHAKKVLDADTVIIAAPFWESSFPATLKAYLERISVPRLTYRYNERGIPEGNCHARLYYVTTRGGPLPDEGDLGLAIIKNTCHAFGITDIRVLSANALDIVGNDVEAILQDAISRIQDII